MSTNNTAATAAPGAVHPSSGETYGATVRRLSGAQKSGKGAPAYSRYVNRRLGRMLAAAAYHLGLTPNTVTLVSGATSFAGIAVIALAEPSWVTGLVVAALLVLGYALDAADGQLARLRGGGSVTGEWLDHIVDALKISTLHLAVLVHLYRFGDLDERWLLVPIGYAIVGAVSFFAQILNEQLVRNRSAHGSVKALERPSLVVSLLKVPTDYGLLCLVFVLLAVTGAFLTAYGLMFLGSAGYLAAGLFKWFRDMRLIDAGAA